MTLANCRAPFRQPAADELGRQHPIIAAQRGKRERKEGKKEQLSGPRLWRGTGLQFQTRLSLPGPSLTPSTEHMTAHIYFSMGSHPSLPFSSRPGSLCPSSAASTSSTTQSSTPILPLSDLSSQLQPAASPYRRASTHSVRGENIEGNKAVSRAGEPVSYQHLEMLINNARGTELGSFLPS